MRTYPLIVQRWARPTQPAEGPSSLRHEARPPSLRQAPDSLWRRALFWLAAPAPQDSAPPAGRLPAIRDDFMTALRDLGGDDAAGLRWRIQQSRSLRELWHLRAEVYRMVAVQYSQAEAEIRLVELNRHFPTRAPRSGFVPL
jgi:hypothetical protein